eukprot:827160-Amphidinium_carterae.1
MVEQSALQRFHQDGGRFPLEHYTASNMVWKDAVARPLDSSERECLMGLPRDYTAALPENE